MENNLTGLPQTDDNSLPDWSDGFSGGENALDLEDFANPESLAEPAEEYTEKLSGAVSQARDYLGDKVSTIGEKIRGLAQDDLGQLAGKAKDFAREKPGQAILVSAAAGVLLGLIIRGRR